MWTLFGIEINGILILQVAVTILIVFGFAILTSLKENKADHESDCQSVLLVSFLVHNHAGYANPHNLTATTDEDLNNKALSKLGYLHRCLKQFQENGQLPRKEAAAQTNILEHVWALLLAPLFAFGAVMVIRDENRKNLCRLYTTEIRKNFMSKMILMMITNGMLTLIPIFLILPHLSENFRWIAYVLVGLGSLGVLFSLAGATMLILAQMAWKEFWIERLFEVMAIAEKAGNHDLFNRAFTMRNYLELQPDTPIPGSLKFYAIVYSAVQAGLYVISQQL